MSVVADANPRMRDHAAAAAPGAPKIPLLATIPISRRHNRIALGVVAALLVSYLMTARYAEIQLPRIDAFVPAVQSILFIVNLVTAVLLFAQFAVQPHRAVLVIGCGYLFAALTVTVHTLTFPGAFAPNGLLGANRQTAGWLFYFWHAGFAVAAIAYALLKDADTAGGTLTWSARNALGFGVVIVVALVGGLTLLAVFGEPPLPTLFQDDLRLNSTAHYLSTVASLIHVFALVLLFLRRRFLLDLWLMVALLTDLPDIGLAVALSSLRFSLGWYAARFYALSAASVLLVLLLAETTALYARLARTARDLIAARDAAEAANRAKSDFLAGMSHEIRTPITCVLGMADLLVESRLTAQQRRHATLLRDAGQSLRAIIDDLLDISKIEAGRLELERVALSPAVVAESALAIVRPSAAAKALDLCSELTDLPAWIEGDPTRLRQVLLNLLSNAIKFTERGSVVLRVTQAAGLLRFEIADTGIGIEPLQRQALFQKFSQAVPSIYRRFGGAGLGLAISRRLVEAMGGAIGVESRIGVGSTFWFTIPYLEARTPRVSETRELAPTGSARILVAEDHDAIGEFIEATLTSAGHEVTLAKDGAEAVAKIEVRDFDLALMDLQMPLMDGLTAIRRIREMGGRARNLPIIAVTAYATTEDRENSRMAGANEHLAKPIDRKELLRLVAKLTGGGQAQPAPAEASVSGEIDGGFLDDLEHRFGKAGVTTFFDEFRNELRSALGAIATGDRRRIAEEMHGLVGITSMFGFGGLSVRSRELMNAARQESGDLSGLVIALETAANQALITITERFLSSPARGEEFKPLLEPSGLPPLLRNG